MTGVVFRAAIRPMSFTGDIVVQPSGFVPAKFVDFRQRPIPSLPYPPLPARYGDCNRCSHKFKIC